jgi:hypothetical protein
VGQQVQITTGAKGGDVVATGAINQLVDGMKATRK